MYDYTEGYDDDDEYYIEEKLVHDWSYLVKNKIVFKDCTPLYTTDLRQLDETLEKSIISFNYNTEKGKYVMEIHESEFLAPPDDDENDDDIDVDIE